MNDIIIAIIGSITTILTAVITGVLAKKEIAKSEENISDEIKKELAKSRKKNIWKIISVIMFFVGILFSVSLVSFRKSWETNSKLESISKSYDNLLLKGLSKKDGNKYIIPSLVMHIQLEKVKDSTGYHLEAYYNIIYNTVYLDSIDINKRSFDDGLRSNRGGEVIQLAGSDKQIITAESTTSKWWNFNYPVKMGDNRMTVTRLKVIYPQNLIDYNSKFFGRLNSNEEEFAFPNSAKDVIGEVVIMVSSTSLNLKLSELNNAAVGSLEDLHPKKWIEPTIKSYTVKNKTETTIVARFPGLEDNEVAKLKVSW